MEFLSSLSWRPGIGDPSLMGWFTVFAYFYTAHKARLVYKAFQVNAIPKLTEAKAGLSKDALLWLMLAAALLLLAINKQLDLQSLFTDVGRSLARQDGWYTERKHVQWVFIRSIALVGFVLALGMVYYFRQNLEKNYVAIAGFSFLVLFVVMRAASFHNFDDLIDYRILGIRMNWVLELGGIGLIAYNAGKLLKVKPNEALLTS